MTEEQKHCLYKRMDNGIHELILINPPHAAIDEMVEQVKTVLETTPVEAPLTRYLIDCSRAGSMPLIHLRRRIKELEQFRPEGREPGRVAIVYDGLLERFAIILLTRAVSNRLGFFKPSEREAALQWLLESE